MLITDRKYIDTSKADGGEFAGMIEDYSQATPEDRKAFMDALNKDDRSNFAYNVLLIASHPLTKLSMRLTRFEDKFTLFVDDLAQLLCDS
jgi:hypothetical protein